MIEHDIANALFEFGVAAAVASSNTPSLAVQYPGRNFTPPDNDNWLEVIHIKNNIGNETWGDEKTYQGFLRLLLHVKNDDTGDLPALTILDDIASQPSLKKGARLRSGTANVLLYDHPDMQTPVSDEGARLFPMSIKYRDFQTA